MIADWLLFHTETPSGAALLCVPHLSYFPGRIVAPSVSLQRVAEILAALSAHLSAFELVGMQ